MKTPLSKTSTYKFGEFYISQKLEQWAEGHYLFFVFVFTIKPFVYFFVREIKQSHYMKNSILGANNRGAKINGIKVQAYYINDKSDHFSNALQFTSK